MTHVTKAHLLQSESDLTNPSKHFTVVFRRFAAPRICVVLVLLLLVSLPASSSLLSLLPPPEASQRLEVWLVSPPSPSEFSGSIKGFNAGTFSQTGLSQN